MSRKLIYLFTLFLFTSCLLQAAKSDSICGKPLRFEVLNTNEPTDGFFWIAADMKYNVYFKGPDLILERKGKKELWLITGATINPYASTEMHIDSVYFKNTGETRQKELILNYTVYSMRPDNSGKSRHMAIIDVKDKVVLLNISLYDYRMNRDENGKYMEYLYECDIDMFHNSIRVTTTDDSDIDNPSIQLDDGVYVRKGHCYISEK